MDLGLQISFSDCADIQPFTKLISQIHSCCYRAVGNISGLKFKEIYAQVAICSVLSVVVRLRYSRVFVPAMTQ
jgi:hypothetical protein